MAYHIYTTRGLVLSQRGVGEADRIYKILTRDLGLVRARALGVRKEVSKLRGALEPYTLAAVSLVRGKEHWRITSAESLKKVPYKESIARPFILLDKFIQGEAANSELFDAIEETIFARETNEEMREIRIVSRILFNLGYLKASDLDLSKEKLIVAINEGIHQSQL